MIYRELLTRRRYRCAAFASGHTRSPKRVVELVEENIESLCLDRRNGGHGSTDRDWPIRVVEHRCELFGDGAIEAEDNLLSHTTNLRECAAEVESTNHSALAGGRGLSDVCV